MVLMQRRASEYFPVNNRKWKRTSRNNDNGVRLVNFATARNIIVKSKKFPHHNIHK